MFCVGVQVCSAAIRIIENTPQKLTFEWTTDAAKVVQNRGGWAELSFSGANVDLGENNEPIIPAYSFYVAVPPQGDAGSNFSVTASHSVVLSHPPRTRIAPHTGRRFPNLVFSQPWISNGRVSLLSDLSCRQFFLRPFVYNPQTKALQVLDKGVFTISFPSVPSRGVAKVQPRSDFKRMARQLVMNYDVASGWPASASLAKSARIKQYPLTVTDAMASFTRGDGHSGISEGTIDENGVIKLMGSDLIRMFGPNVPLSRIELLASYKGELPSETPAFGDIPDGVTEIPMLRFDLGTPGVLDSSDFALAYVSGASDWSYDTMSKAFTYQLDRYTDYRHYWLAVKNSGSTLSLSRMATVTGAVSDTLTSTPGHYLLQRSTWKSLVEKEGGLVWAWTILTANNPSFTYSPVTLPFADAAAPCSVMVQETGFSEGAPVIALSYGGKELCANCACLSWYPAKYPGDNQPITMSIQNRLTDSIELKSFEFRYSQKLNGGDHPAMTVFSPDQPGLVRYRLSGLGSELVYILRIANQDQSIQLVDTVRGQATYEWTDSSGIGIRYYICCQDSLRPAPPLVSVPPKSGSDFVVRDLRLLSGPAIDYLVITYPDFSTQAQRLVRHKRNIGKFVNPKVITINDVYDEFSGGNVDPAAVRNCLDYVRNYQQQFLSDSSFNYVVFMGAGHWDYRGLISASDISFMPVAEVGDKCVEDFFVYLHPGAQAESIDSNSVPDMFLGRFPCHSSQEAGQMVDKVIQTEDPSVADVGVWRNRMLLVADDDMQGLAIDPLKLSHMISSEHVDSLVGGLAPALDVRKVYLFDYPWNTQLEKPEASQAIINTINTGVGMVNYFGHGSDNVWADEHILLPENISNMVNNGKYPIINSFSCSVGKLDKPGTTHSLSEYLVLAQKSAAIAAISATREAYASDNEKLALNFYASVLDTNDNTAARSYGQALVKAKYEGMDNNQKVYGYLGDPSISFTRPGRRISMTIDTGNGRALDTLKALQQVTVHGVISAQGATNASVADGSYGSDPSQPVTVQVTMFNPEYAATRKDGGTADVDFWYNEPGSPLFMGSAQVKNGTFSQRVLIPKNVTFGQCGVRLTAFASRVFDVGIGCKNNIVFSGYSRTGVTDTSGPVISVRPVYTAVTGSSDASSAKGASFTDKISASCPFSMEIDVFDSNGVDIVSTGPDEGLTYQITGPKSVDRKNINQQFQYVQGDYRRGNATIAFDANNQWPMGTYKMAISAQDLFGNVSHRTVELDIVDELELELYHVFNYPNPMRLGDVTRFYFDLSRATVQQNTDEVRVMIRLFTLSGRLIRVFENAKRGQEFDGRDAFGNLLSPGVYLYQISAADQQKVVKGKIEKLAVNPPR
jgi:Peptidase family C25